MPTRCQLLDKEIRRIKMSLSFNKLSLKEVVKDRQKTDTEKSLVVVRRRGLRKVGGCGYKRAIGEILVIVGGILVIMKHLHILKSE